MQNRSRKLASRLSTFAIIDANIDFYYMPIMSIM